MRNTNRVLICYVVRSELGLNNKLRTLVQGFRQSGFEVTELILEASENWPKRVYQWLRVQIAFFYAIIADRHNLVFARYSYQFLLIFLVAKWFDINLQLEMNTDPRQEFKLSEQKMRGWVDALALRLALNSASCVHVVSQELLERFRDLSPTTRFIYNPNYVVDEYFSPRVLQDTTSVPDVANLVFLGDATQPWQGVSAFVERVLAGNEWAKKHTKLYIVGRTSQELQDAIAKFDLRETVAFRGFLAGVEKAEFMRQMDVGIGVFNLGAKGMKETTSIKNAEYLFAGLAVIIGYVDLSLPEESPFVLRINIMNENSCQNRFNAFIRSVRATEGIRIRAHEYAVQNLRVDKYVARVLQSAGFR